MIQSPCVKICTHVDGMCIGCYRTADEIKEWKTTYTDEQKKELLKELKKREESYINNI
jgi:predicted Fe-S protein YdhL (DUF1289 family)